ncbi:DNA-directed RNA polymerase subunit alpha [Spirochaeta africana]|uniref:DNA-directed RNA polymerase subunit alpha n=1 Tax=Spirochaeta africana (strain ATCC 700263 / DSM 8902 / Z-7692) TaxID=889378 RepID=H9UGN5_SPIAZ|nr:DNA-directed RNA polymerase subunit alpha [Spirochaeta africana]AFG36678.1 DNA-directed RNA polymerase, alpha subunit [Spirochaeta africana DSM 8902]
MARKNLLQGFKRPKGITFEHSEVNPEYGKFVAYPFERGYGHTIGNTLRRVLLSSLQGYAISAIRVTSYATDGSAHVLSNEFEAIPEVQEDTADIIYNLRQVRFSLPEDMDSKTIMVNLKGKGRITAADLEVDTDVKVANPELYLMTLMADANIDIEIQVDMGRGYVPSESNEEYIDVVGTIPLDAVYTPIKRVKYEVENTRIGHRTDFDKLILEVWTDGTIKPDDAVAEAAKIAKDHLTIFINFDEDQIVTDEQDDEESRLLESFLSTPVEELELSVRSSNCLKNADIRTIGDLTAKTEDDIAKTRNFGKKSLQEIKEKLAEWNLTLGMSDYSSIKGNLKYHQKAGTGKETQDEA